MVLFRFGNFVLDAARRELRQCEDPVAVEPQVFDLLEFLIQARDRVVSRDDLMAAVWPGRIVSEATLSSRVNSARSAISDNGAEQRLIRTLLRKGVRFVGAVQVVADPAPGSPGDAVLDATIPLLNEPRLPSAAVLPFTNFSGDPQQDCWPRKTRMDRARGLPRSANTHTRRRLRRPVCAPGWWAAARERRL